jgi:ArsR family transcriptional regulator, arsenate/arsenite/antimonite-responsive transcriptional repressor
MKSATTASRLGPANAAHLFHALSDETRLGVLEMLRGGERCVCELQSALDAYQSRLSFHLKVLKDAGLVVDRKEGRWSYYALDVERFEEAQAYLARLVTASPATSGPTLHRLGRGLTVVSAPAAVANRSRVAKGGRGRGGDGCCG